MDKIRVFIGAGPAQRVPAYVLRHSILKNTKAPCDVQILSDLSVRHPRPRNNANRPRTPFSFQRFAIPKLCGYTGRAIYLDSDMVALESLEELWDMDMNGATVLSTDVDPAARNATLLIDCEEARWDLDEIVPSLDRGTRTYKGLMENLEDLGIVDRSIPDDWNRLDSMPVDERTAILHFTDMRRQPWVSAGHPHESVWIKALADALSQPKESKLTAFVMAEAEGARHIRAGLLLISAREMRKAVS